MPISPIQHHIIKETGDTIGQLLQSVFKSHGYKRVHLIVAAPKDDAVEGKLPALSIYLYNILLDDDGTWGNRGGGFLDTIVEEGKTKEIVRQRPVSVRLDYLISTWAQTPEEEQLLMGAAVKGLIENPALQGDQLKGESFEGEEYIPLNFSSKLDEGVLSRFWSSLNQPMKPAIQAWTTVPIYPTTYEEIKRVYEKDIRFDGKHRRPPSGGGSK